MLAPIQHRGWFQVVSTGNNSDCRLLTLTIVENVPFSYWMNRIEAGRVSSNNPQGFTSPMVLKRRGAVFLMECDVLVRWRTERFGVRF